MSKESKKDKDMCPMHNPVTLCPMLERLSKVEEAISWLKKEYTIQIVFTTATFLSVLGLILKIGGII